MKKLWLHYKGKTTTIFKYNGVVIVEINNKIFDINDVLTDNVLNLSKLQLSRISKAIKNIKDDTAFYDIRDIVYNNMDQLFNILKKNNPSYTKIEYSMDILSLEQESTSKLIDEINKKIDKF